jgi:serine/threonine protein phosphatase PrpC
MPLGLRKTNEDCHLIEPNLRGRDDEAIFAICDGHSGRDAARFASKGLPEALKGFLT